MKLWLAQQRYLIDFTLASLARRKTRNLGLLAVYTLLVFMLASVTLYTHALRQEAARVLTASPEVILQRMVAGRHDLIPPGYIEKVGRIRGVQKIEGRLWGYYYDAVTKANYTFMVPAVDAPVAGEIVVGPALERSRGLAKNNGISFRSYSGKLHSFIVADVLPQASELVSADLVLMSEDSFRAFFDYPAGHYTDIALSVANPLEVRNVALKLAAALPDARPILRDEVLRTYASIYDWREGIVLALLSAAILAFGILAWEKASGLSAEEKREIGILKAIGWETGDIIKMKFWEGPADLADRLPRRLRRRLRPCLPFRRRAVRAGAQGLGRALPALPARAAHRRPAGSDAVLLHRGALRRGGAGADLEGGDHRPGFGDAGLR
jgi:hypothetical protein